MSISARQNDATAASAPPHASSGEARRSRPTVLLVDDEPAVRESFGRFLEMCGFRVLRAGTADEALTWVRATAIDAMVLDVRLPGHRSGLEILEFVRVTHAGSERPALVLTGNVLNEDEETLIRRHSAYVFYKPHGYRELAERLQRLCRVRPERSHRERGHAALG